MQIEIWCEIKNAMASKQLYLNVVEDIYAIAKDVQHLLRYDILFLLWSRVTRPIYWIFVIYKRGYRDQTRIDILNKRKSY